MSTAVALHSTQRLAVLGKSGSGRTVLLTRLARIHLHKQAEQDLGTASHLPILLHLAEADWAMASDSDPLGVLLPAATAHVPSLVAPDAGNLMKSRIRNGSAILLLDGLDEATPAQRARIMHWQAAVRAKHPINQVVVTTGLAGYGALQNLGFAALKLSDWAYREIDRATENWIAVLGGGRQDRKVLTEGVRRMSDLAASPIDLMLALMDWRTRARSPAAGSKFTTTG